MPGGGFAPSSHGPTMMPPPAHGFHGPGPPPSFGHWGNETFTGNGYHCGSGDPTGPAAFQEWSPFDEEDEEGFPLVHTSPEWTPAKGPLKAANEDGAEARMSPCSDGEDDGEVGGGGSRSDTNGRGDSGDGGDGRPDDGGSGCGETRSELIKRRGALAAGKGGSASSAVAAAVTARVKEKDKNDEGSLEIKDPVRQTEEGRAPGTADTGPGCGIATAAADAAGAATSSLPAGDPGTSPTDDSKSSAGALLAPLERRLEPKPLAKVMWSIGDLAHQFPR